MHWTVKAITASTFFVSSLISASSPLFEAEREKQYSEFVFMLINKNTLKAELRTLTPQPLNSRVLHKFKIAVGKEMGDKKRRGDNKTPEGIYFTENQIQADQLLTRKYGQLAIPLNFPNHYDLYQKKTGYGIWLHGAGNDKRIAEEYITEGCIAFYNADILKLKHWLQPLKSTVVITHDTKTVNRPRDIEEVQIAFRQWLKSWRTLDLDAYMKHYHQDFKGPQFSNKKKFTAYKKRIFRNYSKIYLGMSNYRILAHKKYAVTMMNQDFLGDNSFRSVGRKVIYWVKQNGTWRIIREHFDEKLFTPVKFSLEKISDLRKITS